jgi:hypothetical protein
MVQTNPQLQEVRPRTVRRRRPFFELVPIIVVGVVVLICILLWRENVQLRRRMDRTELRMHENGMLLEKNQGIVAMLAAGGVQRVNLTAINKQPQPNARCMYVPATGHLLFMASNLAALPAGKSYQLWIIPKSGDAKPVPAGTFKPDAKGDAMVINPPIPTGVEAKAFGVSIEAEAGAQTPTLPMQMTGAGL